MESYNETILANGLKKIIFSWYDYSLFAFMLLGSVFLGIYFGCFGSKQSTANEYLMADKKMKVLPVALSMIASAISGLTILAVPADIYLYGATYWLSCISAIIVAIFTYLIYLPVFYKLQLTSSYEYLKIRFNTKVRLMASFLFILSTFLFLPIVVYVPALAFAQATDFSVHLITPVICGICIFYTTIGGLKAVIWTDTFQFTAMLAAMVAVFYLGLVKAGGFMNIMKTSLDGGRLDLDFSITPLKKDTVWAAVIGLSVNWIAYIGVGQGSVQKFLSLPTMSDCKKTTIIMCIGMILNKTFSVMTGLMIYTMYKDCDPIVTGAVEKADQLIPYFVMDIASSFPGLPGLFIAGVFCASLSTLSAVMNCISGVIYEDFLKKHMPQTITEKRISDILKLIVVITGLISIGLVFLIEQLGNLFPLAMSLGSVASGPLVGLFTLGMVFPRANSKGAFYGGLIALITLSIMTIGSQYCRLNDYYQYVTKPVSVDGCAVPFNGTVPEAIDENNGEDVFFLFRVTYYYYTFTGATITILMGLLISYFTIQDKPLNSDLITPLMHWAIPEENQLEKNLKYYSVDKALNILQVEKENQKNSNGDLTKLKQESEDI
nr:sodium-coupled monocarboxylate transporter 1-like [Onthophagus taurus]